MSQHVASSKNLPKQSQLCPKISQYPSENQPISIGKLANIRWKMNSNPCGYTYKLTLPCGQKSSMTSQATNRREGGSTSCRGRSRKLQAYTQKELETVRGAPELLGAPTTGGGSTRPGGGGGESHRSQISLPSYPKYTKTENKTGGFTYFLAYKSPNTPFFA